VKRSRILVMAEKVTCGGDGGIDQFNGSARVNAARQSFDK